MCQKVDNNLTKNIRPALIIYLVFFLTLIIILDSSTDWFNIKPEYVQLIGTLVGTGIAFYYASRGVEKVYDKKKEGPKNN